MLTSWSRLGAGRLLQALILLAAALVLMPRDGEAAEASSTSGGLEPGGRLGTAEARETLKRRRKLADEKQMLAELLLKIGRYSDALQTVNELLILQPDNQKALTLKSIISARMAEVDEAEMEMETRHRDRAVLREVTKAGMAPERGPDLPRPDPDRADIPFRRDPAEGQRIEEMLSAEIPELNLIDTDLNYVLQLLHKTQGVNLIYPPDAVRDKTITIQAQDVTLRDVLDYLSRQLDLHYTVSRGIIWLYAGGDDRGLDLFRPEVIPLQTGLTYLRSPEGGGGGNEASEVELLLEWMEDHWPGWPPETTWRLDQKTNNLIINSTPETVADVRRIIGMLDEPPVQVLITSIFVEVSKKELEQLGVNWNYRGNPQPAADPEDGYRGRPDRVTIGQDGVNFNPLSGTREPYGFAVDAVGVLAEHQFAATLKALERMERGKLLTAPRIIARNNQVASIEITRNVPYVEKYDTETSGVTSDTSNATATVSTPVWGEVDQGYELVVQPSIGNDKRTISLLAKPTVKYLVGFETANVVTVSAEGEQDPIPVNRPIIEENTVSIEASVLDGQTIVVGGLMRDNLEARKDGIPILSKIPGIGRAFRSSDSTRDRRFLLIFLTARIITPDNRHYGDSETSVRADGVMRSGPDIGPPAQAVPTGGAAGLPATMSPETLNRWFGDPEME